MSRLTTGLLILIFINLSPPTGSDYVLETLSNIFEAISQTHQRYNQRYIDPPDLNFWMQTDEYPVPKESDGYQRDHQYDFIIVGSGSAGSIIANRLSEVPHWKILLLETGKRENFLSRIPLAASILQFTDYDWHYFMERQPNMCLGLENQRMYWPRGRALGGTTVINYMIYTRGNPVDYDQWERAGNPGWSYKEVLPYFMKSERASLKYGDYRYHGVDGYQSVSDVYQPFLVKAFISGSNELGLPHIDYNSPETPFGVSTIQATVLNGRRHSVARAFLEPIRQRRNLHVLTSAYVTRVLIDRHSRQAYGVEYDLDGKKYSVGARKEVILSAGAFNSPQLLMLSGIGPKHHLQELGIPILQDLPVGQNLHDHLTYPGLTFTIQKPGLALLPSKIFSPIEIKRFLLNGTGPITSLGGVTGIGYIKTHLSEEVEARPDIELLFVDGSLAADYGLVTRKGMRIRDDIYEPLLAPLHNIPAWTIFPMLLHPKSTGYLKLKSRNPYDYPLFFGNYFTDPEEQDINTFVASIRFIQKLSRTTPFRKLGSKMNPNPVPGCNIYKFNSDQYWKCALRTIAVTLHHQVGTAKMGPPSDPTSVVNHELKVYGVGRLRVADCSIIPFALGAHTNAPSMMVGEKAADIIKAAWLNL